MLFDWFIVFIVCFIFSTVEEKCLSWKNVIAVIDPEKEAKYSVLIIGKKYESCRVKPLISFRNSSTGIWHLFNLTGNEFIINMNTQPLPSIHVKVCWIIVKLFEVLGNIIWLYNGELNHSFEQSLFEYSYIL